MSCGRGTIEKSDRSQKLETPEPKVKDKGPELDRMIEALANRVNTSPTIEGEGPRSRVFFHEPYDVAEQNRVYEVLRKLNESSGNELWPRLVQHLDDERYALTWYQGNGITRNMTVGDLCGFIAREELRLAYERLSPTENSLGRDRPLVHGPDLTRRKFAEWCKMRQGMQLYEMQIEILEWTTSAPGVLDDLSEEQQAEYVSKVKLEIDRLKRTQEPVVDKNRFESTFFSIYSEKRINDLRDQAQERTERIQRKKGENAKTHEDRVPFGGPSLGDEDQIKSERK
jgi:hypothetical protein